MTEAEIRSGILSFLATGDHSEIITMIPSGSGICHIANVDATNWISGYVGPNPGRWKIEDEAKKHFGNVFPTCANELYGYDREALKGKIFEEWEVMESMPAINIQAFPGDLRAAFYEDMGAAPGKWAKSQILVEELARSPDYSGVTSIYAPSASGHVMGMEGMVLVANPTQCPIRMTRTGSYADYFT